jgi:hypothetical protein
VWYEDWGKLTAMQASSSRRRSGGVWWQHASLDAVSLEEMLSSDAPEELCDPITMTLYEEPVVSPSGETYNKATVARFENRVDPATRQTIEDITKLPPNRAIMRQVNAFIQKHLTAFAEEIQRVSSTGATTGEESMGPTVDSLVSILKVIQDRSDCASLNFKRVVLEGLQASSEHFKSALQGLPLPVQRRLDTALVNLSARSVAEVLMPTLPRLPTAHATAPVPKPTHPVTREEAKQKSADAGANAGQTRAGEPAKGRGKGAKDACHACGGILEEGSGVTAAGR